VMMTTPSKENGKNGGFVIWQTVPVLSRATHILVIHVTTIRHSTQHPPVPFHSSSQERPDPAAISRSQPQHQPVKELVPFLTFPMAAAMPILQIRLCSQDTRPAICPFPFNVALHLPSQCNSINACVVASFTYRFQNSLPSNNNISASRHR
jgi:hypothetical protein